MSNFRFLKNPLTEDYLSLKNDIFGDNISWLYNQQSNDILDVKTSKYQLLPLYYHNVLQRTENGGKLESSYDLESRIRSAGYPRFKSVLDEIFSFNDIEVDCYHRIAVNSCCNASSDNGSVIKSPIHVDHLFEHQQMLIYLTTSSAPTNIYTEKQTSGYDPKVSSYYLGLEEKDILLKMYPHEDQIVTFDGLYYHSYDYPTTDKQRRIVIVCTYS